MSISTVVRYSSKCSRPTVYWFPDKNVALNKPAYQSSQYQDHEAKRAVDGNSDTKFVHGYCSHTQTDYRPWWAVDLGWSIWVDKVGLTTRNATQLGETNDFVFTI